MPIEFQCPRCQSRIQVAESEGGTKLRCPKCQGKVRAPEAPAPAVSDTAIAFLCPRCRTRITAPASQAGAKQRCPKCQSKVQVPPAAAPPRAASIEFLCPRCQAPMSARAEHAGIKQFCPRCGGKVRVPAPSESAVPSTPTEPILSPPAVPAQPHEQPAAAPQPAPLIAALAEDDVLEGLPVATKRRRRKNYLSWLIPVASIALFAGVGSLLLKKPPVKLEGKLAGERVTDIELGPFRVDNNHLGRSRREAQVIFDNLENSPVRAASPSLILEFKGATGGIEILLRTSDQSEFFRVDPGKDKRLTDFIDGAKQKFRDAVDAELERAVPEFVQQVEKRTERDREVKGLADFRDAVGLASLMRGTGFGYHVQAAIDKQAFPCVLEDKQGRLYFALPAGTKEFEIVGRDRSPKSAKDAARFPGRYTVRIGDQTITINKEEPDAREKIRKALQE